MTSRMFDYEDLTEDDRKHVEGLESEMARAREELLDKVPEELVELGNILRRSVEKGDLEEFKQFLEDSSITITVDDSQLEGLRDLLIIQRVDTKDLEQSARFRLRDRTLLNDDPAAATADYTSAVASSGHAPSCKHCDWFVTPPNDGGENSEKSCVEMGTKGADKACYGFTKTIG